MTDGGVVEMSKRTTMYTCGTLQHPVLFFSDEAYPSLLAPEIQDKIKVLKVACGDSHTIAIAEHNAAP
jgi:alpha-tubulin suppressor-like RCC1 family protein